MKIQYRTIRDVDLQKFIKCAEDLESSKEKGKGAFNNKWEWFILRLVSELKQPEKQEIEIAEENVIKYLESAQKVLSKIKYPKSMDTEGIEMIEVAKMIQKEAVNKLLEK